jgi:uroporphyrin-III C-methyltransferase
MGKVYLVGAGPGAPDLLTLRAAGLLERADVVLYDALVHPETVALAVKAKKIAVGKRCGVVSTDQRFINRMLVEAGLRHEIVVRLKGGDPMLFARAREEIDALLAAGLDVEVVPGVTAAFAAAAELKTPLTERGVSRSVTLATPRVGRSERANPLAAVNVGDSLVLYMAVGEAAWVAQALLARGMQPETPIAIVENASLPKVRTFCSTLAELPKFSESDIVGPAILCVGHVFRALGVESGESRAVSAGESSA